MLQNQEIHFTCLSMQIGNIANTFVEIVAFLQMQLQAKSLNWLPGVIFVTLIIPNCLTYLHFLYSSCHRLWNAYNSALGPVVFIFVLNICM